MAKVSMKQIYNEYKYTRMTFGKYKGYFLKDIPTDYITWASTSIDDRYLRHMFQVEVIRRNKTK